MARKVSRRSASSVRMFWTSRLSTVSLGLETDFVAAFADDFDAVFVMPVIVLNSQLNSFTANTSHIRKRK